MSKSPCKECEKEKYCQNTNCYRWHTWFTAEWKKFNNYYKKATEEQLQEGDPTLFNRRNVVQ